MPLPSPREASEQLLGRAPDQISFLVAWPGHAAHRVEVGGAAFVVKVDADRDVVAREVAGHRRAARAGRLPQGAVVMLVGFGVGLSWAATLYRVTTSVTTPVTAADSPWA